MDDKTVSLKEVLVEIDAMPPVKAEGHEFVEKTCLKTRVGLLPSAQSGWIPVTIRPAEGDELKHYMYMFTCEMPYNDQEILVTIRSRHGNHVEKDVCYWEDGASLDSGYDWQADVVAWMPLPKPWEGEQDE